MAIWEVELFIYGPVKVSNVEKFKTQKGTNFNPFFSDIEIKNFDEGLNFKVTAFAPTSELANNAAMVFVGQMLDCLVLDIKVPIPLFLSFDGKKVNFSRNSNVKRFISKGEFKRAFVESLNLLNGEPSFLKAYGWYRKGLYTEDPFDKFLAFYNTIEVVATNYHPKNEASKKGSKSQIWECFKLLWGNCDQWPLIIKDQINWIDDNYNTRVGIAHGLANVNVEEVGKVINMSETIQKVAFMFLRDWKSKQFNQVGQREII
ncbi:methylamine utilization protein MauJ [Bacillus sp. AFS031507]|uniref:methylamine utilization protein MauJ n=1 Tax=Bacillus sp. AFS031507 TaxID=2033496 RepID=UPI000BFE4DBF|nr:methylamine utilization protein MauJ [Bacillus sp. AFS031507]PGY09140.1 hypothetical protein COE25_18945 [Bacillus sp. AFS031507]